MKLYKVERTDYIGWDEYDAVVVYATDEENAKRIGIQYMSTQEELGRHFTEEQMMWLEMIKEHLYASLTISIEDFENSPFYSRGGILKAYKVFGPDLDKVLKELEEVLVRA